MKILAIVMLALSLQAQAMVRPPAKLARIESGRWRMRLAAQAKADDLKKADAEVDKRIRMGELDAVVEVAEDSADLVIEVYQDLGYQAHKAVLTAAAEGRVVIILEW